MRLEVSPDSGRENREGGNCRQSHAGQWWARGVSSGDNGRESHYNEK